MAEDRKEPGDSGEGQTAGPAKPVLAVKAQKHVDTEAAWIKKAGKLRFGYKSILQQMTRGLSGQ